MTLSVLMQKGGLAKLATATAATLATHKTTQQVSVAAVACVAVATTLETLITKPQNVFVSHMTPKDEAVIRAWLMHIEETDLEIISHVLNQCCSDNEARIYFISRASEMPHSNIPAL